MAIIRQYPILCPSCGGNGFINNPQPGWTTLLTIPCPVCQGAKTVICTETIQEDFKIQESPQEQ